MKVLLDTHVVLWWAAGDRRLRPTAAGLIANPDNTLLLSALSVWEWTIKVALGRLQAPDGMRDRCVAAGMVPLAFDGRHAEAVGSLPPLHADPFDRGLVAQAGVEGAVLLSADARVLAYPVWPPAPVALPTSESLSANHAHVRARPQPSPIPSSGVRN